MNHVRYGICIAVASILAGCTELTSVQLYDGPSKADSELSIVRLWTRTETTIYQSPGLIVQKIDGKDAHPDGSGSYAYILPGEHEFQVHLVQIHGYNLLCGALCDAAFNKPQFVKTNTQAGHAYTLRYVDDEKGTLIVDDHGTNYDPRCLKALEFKDCWRGA